MSTFSFVLYFLLSPFPNFSAFDPFLAPPSPLTQNSACDFNEFLNHSRLNHARYLSLKQLLRQTTADFILSENTNILSVFCLFYTLYLYSCVYTLYLYSCVYTLYLYSILLSTTRKSLWWWGLRYTVLKTITHTPCKQRKDTASVAISSVDIPMFNCWRNRQTRR